MVVESITLDPVTRLATVKFDLDGKLTSFNTEQLKKCKNALEELRYSSDYQQADAAKQKAMEQQLISNTTSITSWMRMLILWLQPMAYWVRSI